VSERPAPARLHSLCGTSRKLKAKNQKKLSGKHGPARMPCRPSGIWACVGVGERTRRLPDIARCARA
jgi:hypothetical protein